MKKINHPYIVQFVEAEDIDDNHYIFMELMSGGNLANRIWNSKNEYLSEQFTQLLFYQLCHALKYLHARNITHRDLKPENLLLTSKNTDALFKISDFGLSKLCRSGSTLRTQCGTS